jgi:hypothetical protein
MFQLDGTRHVTCCSHLSHLKMLFMSSESRTQTTCTLPHLKTGKELLLFASYWQYLRKQLKVFLVQGTPHPTFFRELWNVKQVLELDTSRRNPIIALMVSNMKAKFDKYWKISYLSNCIPVILDPRFKFKFKFVEFLLKQAFGGTLLSILIK